MYVAEAILEGNSKSWYCKTRLLYLNVQMGMAINIFTYVCYGCSIAILVFYTSTSFMFSKSHLIFAQYFYAGPM